MKMNFTAIVLAITVTCASLSAEPPKQSAPLVEEFLFKGDLAGGEKALTEAIKKSSDPDDLKFQLGALQFIRAVERAAQSFNHYGLVDFHGILPFPQAAPSPSRPPKAISYNDCRKIMETWLSDLQRAEATLAQVKKADVKLPLHFAMIRLDFDGDGKSNEDETLWKIFARMGAGATAQSAADFVIDFDLADAVWLRGYCHLLMAIDEFLLAHDFQELFERTCHIIFAKVKSPYEYLQSGPKIFEMGHFDIADVIAFVHLINFPIKDAARLKNVLTHLESMTKLSREMWKLVMAETDDDHEWIPNPKQTSVIPGGKVTEEMVNDWSVFLNELDDILAGKKLIPFWRSADDRGINIRKVLMDPRPFDLVLWVQGSAALPYLEKGPVTTPQVWQRLQRTFEGNFIGFAVWFN
jgi:hypothetical protein